MVVLWDRSTTGDDSDGDKIGPVKASSVQTTPTAGGAFVHNAIDSSTIVDTVGQYLRVGLNP